MRAGENLPGGGRKNGRGAALFVLLYAALAAGVIAIAAQYAYQWVDGAWNAQVAVSLAGSGRYAIRYPSQEVFYVPITTGQTVLLPAALSVRLLGVNALSVSLVPVLYMLLALFFVMLALRRFFSAWGLGGAKGTALAALCAAALDYGFSLYGRYAYQLLGEGAAVCFLAAACLCLGGYARSGRRRYALLCGAALACALVTKTVTIGFIAVFAMMMLMECALTRRYPPRTLALMAAGFAAAFAALEAIKLIQLGGGISAYIAWWEDTLRYSFGLSSGEAAQLSFGARIAANLEAAAALFSVGNIPALLAMMLLAPLCYLISVAARLTGRRDPFAQPGRFSLLALGLCGDGFVAAAVLLTSGGMFTERRMLIHGVCFMAFVVAMLALAAARGMARRTWKDSAAGLLAAALLICCVLPGAADGLRAQIHYAQGEDAQRGRDTQALMEAVKSLGEDAQFYGCGWNFAAETMLFCGLDLHDLEYGAPASLEGGGHYVIAESYAIGEDVKDMYAMETVWQLREGEGTYCIYRITRLP